MSGSDDRLPSWLESGIKKWKVKEKEKTTKRNIKLVPIFIALVWNIIMVAIGAEASTYITLIFYSSTVMIIPSFH